MSLSQKLSRIGPTILKTSILKTIFFTLRLQQAMNNMVNVSFVRMDSPTKTQRSASEKRVCTHCCILVKFEKIKSSKSD